MKLLIKKILKEEIDSYDKTIFNFLARRADIRDKKIGDENDFLKVKEVQFSLDGETYGLNSFMSKKEMTWKLLNMLQDNEVINLGEYNPNVLDTDRQRVIKAIRKFIDQVFK